jgi:hypothetical protein
MINKLFFYDLNWYFGLLIQVLWLVQPPADEPLHFEVRETIWIPFVTTIEIKKSDNLFSILYNTIKPWIGRSVNPFPNALNVKSLTTPA